MPQVIVAADRLEQWTPDGRDRAAIIARQDHLAEILLRRARHLPERQRTLLKLVLERRLPVREVAAITGASPGTVSRRVRSLIERLRDPVVAAVADASCTLGEGDRQLYLGHHLRRESIALLARSNGMTRCEVRRRLQWVRGWALGRREGARVAGALRRPRERR